MRPCVLSIVCYLFSCQVLFLVMTRFLRTFLCVKQKVDHRGIRTTNLLIPSQTLYPLGHAAICPVNCICYLFSCQVLSLIFTSFVRTFFCVKQNVEHRGIGTPNLLIRSQTPYPLGHAAMCHVNCICYLFSCQVLSLVLTPFLRNFLCVKQKVDHRGIRTPNLLIRSQTLYPLSHAAMCTVNCMLLIQLPSVVPCVDSISKKFPLCQTKSRPQRDSNPQSSDSKSDALPSLCNATMCHVNCICYLFSCQVLSLVLTPFLRSFLCVNQKVDHRGIRTPSLLIRSQTPYPLGHAAMCSVNCICCLFSCQVLSLIFTSFVRTFFCVKQNVEHRGIGTPNLLIRSQTPYPRCAMRPCILSIVCYLFSCQVLFLVMTRFLRTFLCVKQKVDHRGIRTTNLLIPSQTLYPLSHAAMCTVNCMLLIQVPSVVSCNDSISKNFPLCQTKSRPQRDSNHQSSDSKSDALSVGPCGHMSCQLYLLLVQLPSVVPYIHILCKNFLLCQTKCRTQRNWNPQSSDSKSDALPPLCNAAMYPVNCMLLIQLPSVVPSVDSISKKFPFCQTKSRP